MESENDELKKLSQGTVGDQIKVYMNTNGQIDVGAEVFSFLPPLYYFRHQELKKDRKNLAT